MIWIQAHFCDSLVIGLSAEVLVWRTETCYALCENIRQMKMNRDQILKKPEENLETGRGFGVRCLGIFGSCAR